MAQRTLNRRSRRDEVEDDQYDERDEAQDDEEPPRRGRSRGRSRDEDDEEETPRRGRRSSRRDPDEEEDEAPRRSRRSSGRSRDDEDEDDDEPRGRSSRPKATGKGWGGYSSKRAETRSSDYVENYKLPTQAELIKFLDEEPFSVYNEHWIEEARKKSWTCIGDDCPLCNIGDKAKTYALFNVLDLRAGEDPKVVPLKASPMVADLLEEYARDKKTSPLNREDLYFSIQKKGGGTKGRVQVIVNPVKARDLAEDWDFDPLTDAEIEAYEAEMYAEEDVVQFASRKTLKSVADELD